MSKHYTVLKDEAVSLLEIDKDGIYVDATLGRAGHSLEIVKRLDKGRLYCFDLDPQAIKQCQIILKDYLDKVEIIHDNFANMFKYVTKVDGILLDLGVSSPQFDEVDRGFTYRYDAKLDMRMNLDQQFSAYELINTYSQTELFRIFRDYGEEKFAYQIAKNICQSRLDHPIKTTLELVEIIRNSKPQKVLKEKGHPAKQVFQAIRIAVNEELKALEQFLNEFSNHLNKGARVVVITFHSLEDRLVKRKFKELSQDKDDKNLVLKVSEIEKAEFELINKKVILPSEIELAQNNRSKSAKLRAIKKI